MQMKHAKILLASLFAVLIIVGLSQPASAVLNPPDLVIDPHGIDVNVLSTFTIDIWIKNIPMYWAMRGFEFLVVWDPTMMKLADDYFTDHGWTCLKDVDVANGIYGAAGTAPGGLGSLTGDWTDNAIWLTLEFRCLAESSTEIQVHDSTSGTVTLRQTQEPFQSDLFPFDSDTITVNQHAAPPSGPSGYVGGEVFSANKLAVLSPYLALVSVVAIAAVVVRKKLT